MASSNEAPPDEASSPSAIPILDFFFPGFTNMYALASNLNNYARLLCVCGIAVFLARSAFRYLWDLVGIHISSTVQVLESDEAYEMLVTWASTQPFARSARSSLARACRKLTPFDNSRIEKKRLSYSPWNGTFYFFHDKQLFWYQSRYKDSGFRITEEVSISCLGAPEALKGLFDECRREYLKLTRKKTSVFEPQNGSWKRTRTADIRPISTVIMDEMKKVELLSDIRAFLDPHTQQWYSQMSLPYKKGYLLYGPPGTGKSSLSLSIAGCFDLEIYMLNLSGVDEPSLKCLFSELPSPCVVLLEDVDAVDTTQTRQSEQADINQGNGSGKVKGKVSLSVLLNALDGVASQEGRMLIMTTNHIERLDPALIRPGRIDKKVELKLAKKDIAVRIFSKIYKRSDDDMTSEEAAEHDAALAQAFADKMPEGEFSPAEITSFLVENRHSPDKAVENVQQWVARTREEKARMKMGS